jgi:hypothetical protein
MTTAAARRVSLAGAGVAAIHLFALLLVRSATFGAAPEVFGVGLTIDLTLTATFVVWLVAVRPGHLPAVALVPVFAGGVLVARLILPPEGRGAVALAGGAMVAVELGLAVLAVSRARRVIARFRVARADGATRRDALAAGLEAAIGSPRLAGFLATEVAIVGYAATGWFRRAPRDAGDFFAVHRRRAWTVIAATLVFLGVVETLAVHVLLSRASPLAAWIATATSIYALVWVIGDTHALRLGGLRVAPRHLEATLGLRWSFRIPRAAIRSVARIGAKLPRAHDLAACELLWPDVLVELAEPVEIAGPLGSRRRVTRLTFSCDRPDDLVAMLGPLPETSGAL